MYFFRYMTLLFVLAFFCFSADFSNQANAELPQTIDQLMPDSPTLQNFQKNLKKHTRTFNRMPKMRPNKKDLIEYTIQDINWIDHVKKQHEIMWWTDIDHFVGVVVLDSKSIPNITTDSFNYDCKIFPFYCWDHSISIGIGERQLFYNLCSGSDAESECGLIAEEWRQKLEEGYQMRVIFSRDFNYGSGWFNAEPGWSSVFIIVAFDFTMDSEQNNTQN